uniref:Uncharacterized protein n=1 Tax=viral metagenome TaxID=1070528 RepID=A0A6C0F9E0_9ZZZZ|tara:strand:+ start:19173 stop:20336 length:1164 start_codon:yes stop_codon:yes gene_type:complete
MSVSAFEVGAANQFIQSQASKGNQIDDSKNIETLYKDGKEYTYLLTITGKDSEESVTISPGFENVVSVEVVQARIPFTEYTIESDRNTVNFTVNSTTFSITFPTQDYNNDTLMEMFNAKAKRLGNWGQTIRLGEEEGTGKYFFYTVRHNGSGETVIPEDPDHNDCASFTILPTTTAFYPLGIYKKLGEAPLSSSDDVTLTTVVNSALSDKIYRRLLRCPYRYDLIVGDIVMLRCPELDSYLNRGHESDNVMPLGEFFLSSPGMNESTFQKDIPDRPIAPPMSLNTLTLQFQRDNAGSNVNEKVNYNFRGVRWFIKVAIKTLEIPSASSLSTSSKSSNHMNSITEVPENIGALTDGFRNTNLYGSRRSVMQGNTRNVSSMMISPVEQN